MIDLENNIVFYLKPDPLELPQRIDIEGNPKFVLDNTMGLCLLLDGKRDYIKANIPRLDGDFTLSAWFYLTDDPVDRDWKPVLSKPTIPFESREAHNGNAEFDLEVNNSGILDLIMGCDPNDPRAYGIFEQVFVYPLKKDEWYHVVVTMEADTMVSYLNGNESVRVPFKGTRQIGDEPLLIGYYYNDSGKAMYWKGKLAHIRVYKRALTAVEITELWNLDPKYKDELSSQEYINKLVTSDVDRSLTGVVLLQLPGILEEVWKTSDAEKVLLCITAALEFEYDQKVRIDAAKWLRDKLPFISNKSIDIVRDALQDRLLREKEYVVREQLQEVRDQLTEQREWERFKTQLRSLNETIQRQAVDGLLKKGGVTALRILVEEWARWIATDDRSRGLMIEETAERMRRQSNAVLPLVQQLEQDVQYELSNEVIPLEKSEQQNAELGENAQTSNTGASKEIQDWIKEQVILELKHLDLTPDPERVKHLVYRQMGRLGDNRQQSLENFVKKSRQLNTDDGHIREEIQTLIETEVKDRKLKVHRLIARLLANMSDMESFEKNDPVYNDIKTALERHAVRKLGPRLSKEPDPEIRNDLAIMLGNIGGYQAIDALARAVVGQELTRANRQKLLAQYYLDPSREQSKQAANILEGAVVQAKRTLLLLQGLNVIVFIVGMIILLAGLYFSMSSTDNGRVAGALASIGGLAGVITMLIRNPLNRIQDAMANLVQLETAFTSFIWELNLNSTYIQSQYVAEGVLTTSDISQTIKRIEDAMNLTMSQVAAHTELGSQLFIPHLTKISPVVGKLGEPINIYGINLRKEIGESNNGGNILTLAINHIPVLTQDISKNKEELKITLPSKETLPNELKVENGLIWISLVVDGMETNAMPFRLAKNEE